MKDFRIIFFTYIKIIAKTIASTNAIRLASFIFVIGCFLAGSYYILFRIFTYLMAIEIIGSALMDRVIEMTFFVFFIMLLFSNVITSFSTFYNDKELDFLFSLPVRPTSIYLAKLFENCIYASWATMVIALPLVIAYGISTSAQPLYYPVSIISILVYLIIPAAIASLVIFIIFRLFPRLKSRDVIILSLISIIGLTFLYININNPEFLKMFETESEKELLKFATNLTSIGGVYVPSTWLSNILKGLRTDLNQGIFYFLLLLFVSLSTIIFAFFTAKVLYAQSWLLIGERETKKKKKKITTLFIPNRFCKYIHFQRFTHLYSRTCTMGTIVDIHHSLNSIYLFFKENTYLLHFSTVAHNCIICKFCLYKLCSGNLGCQVYISCNQFRTFWNMVSWFLAFFIQKNYQIKIFLQSANRSYNHGRAVNFLQYFYKN